MVIPDPRPNILAGNYRVIIELLARGRSHGIYYKCLEIASLKEVRSLIANTMSIEVPEDIESIKIHVPRTLLHIKEKTIFALAFMIQLIMNLQKIYREAKNAQLIHVPDIVPLWVLSGIFLNMLMRKPLIIRVQLLPSWIRESKGYLDIIKWFIRKKDILKGL
jgi:hypothetical protein